MRARFRAFLVLNCIFLLGTSNASADVSLHPATRALINKFFHALTSPISQRKIVIAEVATLGCPQDGQAGPQDAPTLPKSMRVILPEGMGSSLVYYSAKEAIGSGVLAPRGWDCFGLYGSGGSTLYVIPRRLGDPILDRPDKLKEGPAVIKTIFIGGTSGRFSVARISARIFPSARAFVERVRDEGLDDPKDYVFAPWPTDKLRRLSEVSVSYVTPSGIHGLGTALGLAPGREPISGFAFLSDIDGNADGPVLAGLAVRLHPSEQRLYPAIAVAGIIAMAPAFQDAAEHVRLPAALLGGWCLTPTEGGNPNLYHRVKSHEACYTSSIDIRQDGYEGQDGTDGPKMACRIISSTVEIIPDFHNPSSKYFNSPIFSDHYTIRSECRGARLNWQEKNTIYIEKGLLIVERGSRPTR